MSVSEEVLCNHPLFGEHRGETHRTHSLGSVSPGDTYEITASGRLKLLECTHDGHHWDLSMPQGLVFRSACLRVGQAANTNQFFGGKRSQDFKVEGGIPARAVVALLLEAGSVLIPGSKPAR